MHVCQEASQVLCNDQPLPCRGNRTCTSSKISAFDLYRNGSKGEADQRRQVAQQASRFPLVHLRAARSRCSIEGHWWK